MSDDVDRSGRVRAAEHLLDARLLDVEGFQVREMRAATRERRKNPIARTPGRPASLLSHEDDPRRRDRRSRAVMADVQLHLTGGPCDGCGGTARLSGGDGCRCPVSAATLAVRCTDVSHRAPARQPEFVPAMTQCPKCFGNVYPSMIIRRQAS